MENNPSESAGCLFLLAFFYEYFYNSDLSQYKATFLKYENSFLKSIYVFQNNQKKTLNLFFRSKYKKKQLKKITNLNSSQ